MDFFSVESLIALLTLTSLEIVLGIDNIVFLAITTARLPANKQSSTRKIGLALAMLMRIGLLFTISWVVGLTKPFWVMFGHPISGRDMILLGGGVFLIVKSALEVHGMIKGEESNPHAEPKATTVTSALIQIMILDIIFSLDSVITAVGMVNDIPVMIAAVVAAVAVMMIFANPVSEFIVRHPTIKVLALAFLLLIGLLLMAEGFGKHVDKGYVYFAMGFAVFVEFLNFRLRKSRGLG